jgi:hypothetical protein
VDSHDRHTCASARTVHRVRHAYNASLSPFDGSIALTEGDDMQSGNTTDMGSVFGLSATLRRLSTTQDRSRFSTHIALLPYKVTGYMGRLGLDEGRLIRTIALPNDPLADAPGPLPPIDVVVPCGPNDLSMLADVTGRVQAGSTNRIANTIAIVPPKSMEEAKRVVPSGVQVVDETDLLGHRLVENVGAAFPARRNWVLQQLVKVAFVLQSDARGVLVLDADTLLLKPRVWLDEKGTQALTPTFEWHSDYYEFLSKLSQGQWPNPSYSFVPHHMLMQPMEFRRTLTSLQMGTIDDLVAALGRETDYANQSMFSIEYELYAQGLMANSPQSVALAKWCNTSSTRNQSLASHPEAVGDYMSLSLHHYLG